MSKKLKFEEIGKFLNGRSIRYIKVDSENYSEYWHYHPEVEITFVERGSGMRIVGENLSAFENGDLVLLGKNLPHCYIINDPKNIKIHLSHALQFPIKIFNYLPDLQVLNSFLVDASVGYYFPAPSSALRNRIINFTQLPKHEQFLSFLQIIIELYNDTNRHPISQDIFEPSNMGKNRINMALRLIYKSEGKVLSLGECASKMNMSKTYFCRWFKQATRHTFTEYRDKVMVEKFCQELVLCDENISSVAFKIGFENIQSFNRIFKKVKGVSPKVYRQNHSSSINPNNLTQLN